MATIRKLLQHSTGATQAPSIVRLWILRMLVLLNGQRKLIERGGFSNDTLAEFAGLGEWVHRDDGDFDEKRIRADLRRLHLAAEKDAGSHGVPPALAQNVQRLGALSGMSPADCRLLEFAVLIRNEQLLDDAADTLGRLGMANLHHVLGTILGVTSGMMAGALSDKGVLCRTGMVSVDRSASTYLGSKLNFMSDAFANRLYSVAADPIDFLRDTVMLCSPPDLVMEDYEHLSTSLTLLKTYLGHAVDSGRKGVNVFLHGMPGTGKTQLSRVLAKELGCELFEISSEDCDGDPISGSSRLRAYRAAQNLFGPRRVLMLFDEAEDVFDDSSVRFGRRSTAQSHKSWINRALEENTVPTLWLSNQVACLDPAFIRRFDLVVELPIPPKAQRERIIENSGAGLLSGATISRMAESTQLAAGVVARASNVVRCIRDELGDAEAAGAIELLVNNTLEAQGHRPVRRPNDPQALPDIYDPAFIEADVDLAEVSRGLTSAGAGRLCLYGPPGTGKTAYGKWLAEQLDRPLLARRASDLMSKWVGGTEKNIAAAFKAAERERAVLLIDEVDSFLQDRRRAGRSWEVTGVNEMLTQMEAFPGVLVASTNLTQGFDPAALRRFDLKVKFGYLRGDQAWRLFGRVCESLDIPKPGQAASRVVRGLANLTPGDFAAAARQHRFRPYVSALGFANALAAECAHKEAAPRRVGFF
ncbi:MAG TPA: AAA family ATPase [Burkholderiaceae bacterium]|nr:AAA family ATPase [Burkholderiaceae bacterium]